MSDGVDWSLIVSSGIGATGTIVSAWVATRVRKLDHRTREIHEQVDSGKQELVKFLQGAGSVLGPNAADDPPAVPDPPGKRAETP